MVRVNIINPKLLLDQHLLAEWNEIQMLLGTIVKHPIIKWQPESYKLGKGHINFFKDKAIYLFDRLKYLHPELEARGYSVMDPNAVIRAYNGDIHISNKHTWIAAKDDFKIIHKRLMEKHAMKPNWYTYYGKCLTEDEYKELLATGELRK